MKAVILGTDFVYNKDEELIPIEINTNISMSTVYVENSDDVFDMTDFQSFVSQNGFVKVIYIGPNVLAKFKSKLIEVCNNLSIEFEQIYVSDAAITIPYVEDSEDILILRSSFDTTAILDENYCANEVNYMNLIKNQSFGSQFAYLDDNGNLINNITNIKDNGIHPNFILKSISPNYNEDIYPKLYRVTNQSELNIVLANIPTGYFLMDFHFNPSKTYLGVWTKFRKISLLFPPNLESIHLGSYTDLATLKLSQNITYDQNTFELDYQFRNIYITNKKTFVQPKLMDDDYVVMADGTRKSGLDLQVGDILKTIDIPNPYDVDTADPSANYHINLETFLSGTTYSTNAVLKKERVEALTFIVTINFDDTTTWMDTEGSSYLIYKENEIQFKEIDQLEGGDVVLLIDTSDTESVDIIQKTVSSVVKTKEIFEGWIIEVERRHLFLTATEGPNNMSPSYVAIEHNLACKAPKQCQPLPTQQCCYKGECQLCVVP